MTNPAGTRFATAVVAYLRDHGHPYAERRAHHGRNDRGDITGIPGVVLECKATKNLDVAAAVDEAAIEARNDGASIYAAIIKRRQRSVADAYMIMPLHVGAELLRDPDTAELAALRQFKATISAAVKSPLSMLEVIGDVVAALDRLNDLESGEVGA